MKARIGTSFGLALLLAIGVVATMLALGMLNPSKAAAGHEGIVIADGTQKIVPDEPGVNSTWTMNFRNHEALAANSGQIYVKFAFTVGVPSAIEKERITISASGGGVSNPVFDPEVTASSGGEPIVILTVGDVDPSTAGTQSLDAYIEPCSGASQDVCGQTTNTNSGHVLQFSRLAGLTNSTYPSSQYSTYVHMSADGSTYGTARTFTVNRWLSLSSGSGAKGKSITLTGKAFQSGGTANVWLDTDSDGVMDSGETVLGTSDAAISGGSFTATFTVGDSFIVGANSLNAIDGTGTAPTAPYINATPRLGAQKFTKIGSIAVSPASASRGQTITVTLDDFGGSASADGTVSAITFGGVPGTVSAGSGYTDSDGTVYVAVPATTPLGTQTVSLTSAATSGSAESARTATITVISGFAISASPSTAVANQTITVSGAGFKGGSTVAANTITVSGIDGVGTATATHSAITIDDAGNLITTFALPHGDTADPSGYLRVAGDHEIKVVDATGRIGVATVTVPAKSITMDTATSRRGSTVTLTGSGFSASTTVTIVYGSTTVATVTADSAGDLPAGTSFVVPSTATIPSANWVSASIGTPSSGTNRAAGGYHSVPGASITVDKDTAASGETVTITGLDFPGYVSLSLLEIGGVSAMSTPAPSTESDGSFTAPVLVPALGTGTQTILVTAGGTSANLPITVTAAAATPVVTTSGTETTFADEIASDNLVRVWSYSNEAQEWSFYDPRPSFADANNYSSTTSGDIVWVNVTAATTFQSKDLYAGWNLIALD